MQRRWSSSRDPNGENRGSCLLDGGARGCYRCGAPQTRTLVKCSPCTRELILAPSSGPIQVLPALASGILFPACPAPGLSLPPQGQCSHDEDDAEGQEGQGCGSSSPRLLPVSLVIQVLRCLQMDWSCFGDLYHGEVGLFPSHSLQGPRLPFPSSPSQTQNTNGREERRLLLRPVRHESAGCSLSCLYLQF